MSALSDYFDKIILVTCIQTIGNVYPNIQASISSSSPPTGHCTVSNVNKDGTVDVKVTSTGQTVKNVIPGDQPTGVGSTSILLGGTKLQ